MEKKTSEGKTKPLEELVKTLKPEDEEVIQAILEEKDYSDAWDTMDTLFWGENPCDPKVVKREYDEAVKWEGDEVEKEMKEKAESYYIVSLFSYDSITSYLAIPKREGLKIALLSKWCLNPSEGIRYGVKFFSNMEELVEEFFEGGPACLALLIGNILRRGDMKDIAKRLQEITLSHLPFLQG